VQSISKNKIKWIRSLQLKKNREELGLFIVEGEKMVNEALKTFGNDIEFLCLTKNSSIVIKNPTFEVAIASDEE
jgi:tRNA G18 (ribose-2'-O)-methylase SpoU